MSSGRDVWMESWQQEQYIRKTQEPYIRKNQLQRMVEYRQTLLDEVERITNIIKELEK